MRAMLAQLPPAQESSCLFHGTTSRRNRYRTVRHEGRCACVVVGFYNRWFKTEILPKLDSPVLLVASPIRQPSSAVA